jgi:hypothetical protein|tara:strand:- start:944 stop:1231 length:288 start_codon:yes stop_codon:yes gene_type:complete
MKDKELIKCKKCDHLWSVSLDCPKCNPVAKGEDHSQDAGKQNHKLTLPTGSEKSLPDIFQDKDEPYEECPIHKINYAVCPCVSLDYGEVAGDEVK